MARPQNKRRRSNRKQVIYNTPGRECAHADKGCCPACLNPMAALSYTPGGALDSWTRARMRTSLANVASRIMINGRAVAGTGHGSAK